VTSAQTVARTWAHRLAAHPLRQRRLWVPLAAVLAVIHLPFWHAWLRGPREVAVAVPFRDDFDRTALGGAWWSNGGHWRIADGELYSPGVGNNPLWLKARLPRDVRISFDARAEAGGFDLKWEAFGDGRNHATGYVFIFGGWSNRETRIAKLDEHALTVDETRAQLAALARPVARGGSWLERAQEALARPFTAWRARRDLSRLAAGSYYGEETPLVVKRLDLRVAKGRRYHMTITRQGGSLRWEIDGQPALRLDDPAPLSGPGHDRFGFSSWANDSYFDNLVIEPL
jgi:hypothetical protein